MESAWHACNNEAHGRESLPTLRLNRKADRPFHIDYGFVPKSYTPKIDIAIGKFASRKEDEVSDHATLMLDIGL